ncbi:hypothetical protein H7F02_18645, partial [Proteus mirabilis]|nr:hypothetical protein [Proteus mirabilis]
HHLVAITKGKSLGPTVRSFGPFEATSCRGLEPVVRDVQHCFPISFEVVSRVYRYLRTLKKPDAQSAMAKLSQLLPEPTGIEIKFLQDFADLVIGTSTINTMIKPARAKIFFGGWLRKLPKILVSRFGVVKELSLDEFVSYMEPYHFQVELMDIGWNYAHSLDLYSMAEADFGVDVVKLIDDRFIYGTSSEIIDRTPQPYTSLLACVERRRELIAIPTAALESFCCSVL